MDFRKEIRINDFSVSENSRTFVVAEAGINHGGDLRLAKRLIEVAKAAGADAVKFQFFKTENLILKNVPRAPYQLKNTGSRESQFDMLKNLELTKKEIKVLKYYCQKQEITFLITPFDEESLDELDEIGPPAYKVASTDLTNLPFLRKIAAKGKPLLLSTGMSYFDEIELALQEIFPFNSEVILLQCSANYPIVDEDVNLNVITMFRKSFNILVGYSDHTAGIGAAPYAVALGAKVIEKHFTLNKNLKGPDHAASLSPKELRLFIKRVRKVEKYMGSGEKAPANSEMDNRILLQKCLVAKRSIKRGKPFTIDNIIAKRTGGIGISPILYKGVIGLISDKNYKKDDIINLWKRK